MVTGTEALSVVKESKAPSAERTGHANETWCHGDDPGEDADVTLPGGKRARVRLDRNDFATFSGGRFSFVHPSSISVTKTDLGESITQYLAA